MAKQTDARIPARTPPFFDRERSAYLEGIVEPTCHFAQRESVGHGYLSSTYEALFSVFECETIYLPASRVRSVGTQIGMSFCLAASSR